MAVISVITPIYNTEKLLGRCVDSILRQTFRDFELILVDDGSTDGSGRLCDELAARDSRIVALHQNNSGVGAARNTGLDWVFGNSDSRWITFVDSDDWIHPRMLELLLNAAGRGSAPAAIRSCQTGGWRFRKTLESRKSGHLRTFTGSSRFWPRCPGANSMPEAALKPSAIPWEPYLTTNM